MAEPKRPWPKRPWPKRPWPKRPTFDTRIASLYGGFLMAMSYTVFYRAPAN